VFYANDRENPGWKVVLQKEVRGKCVHDTVGLEEAGSMFATGQDVEFEGLRAPETVAEENPPAMRTGKNFQREDVYAH
jgi:hypothetical protein